jgi:HPt (histidine-containing phosphotransfer) domain-containing protein
LPGETKAFLRFSCTEASGENGSVQVYHPTAVLDREQLRDITMDDSELMRELLAALLEDTSNQVGLIEAAIRERDPIQCRRLAHYSKGACANMGANAVAAKFQEMEQRASSGDLDQCGVSLAALAEELARLRNEAEGI